jgi:DNA repair exonuclease SbcCD ATPase subunit
MVTNTKEYMREYMKRYAQNASKVECDVCGKEYRKHKKAVHCKTKYHLDAMNKDTDISETDLKKLQEQLKEITEVLKKFK